MAGWFKRTDTTDFNTLVSKMEISGAYPGWYFFWRQDGHEFAPNGIELYMRDDAGGTGDGYLSVSSEPVTDSDWVHLAATYNGGSDPSDVTLYLNGQVLSIAEDVDEEFTTSSTTDNSAPFNIGGRNDAGSLDGFADEVGVWNRELSQTEIQTVMNIIPEPASALLLALGGLALLKRRPRRA